MGEIVTFPNKGTKIIVERAPAKPWVFLVFVKDGGWYEQDLVSAHTTHEGALREAHKLVPLYPGGYVCDEVA